MYSGPAIGLWSSPNPFSKTPAGALKRADNVRFISPGVLGPRPGFEELTSFGSASSLADQLAFYAGDILLAYDLTKVSLYQGSSFTDFSGTFAPVGANRMRFEGAARSVFFNTADGLKVWDGVGASGQPVDAGNQLPLTPTGQPSGQNGWQPADSAVAYRYTFCKKDAFQRVVEGPPSGRLIVRNLIEIPLGVGLSRSSNVVTAAYNIGGPNAGSYTFLTIGDSVVMSPGAGSFTAGTFTITSVDNVNGVFTYAQAGPDGAAPGVTQFYSIATSGKINIPLAAGSHQMADTDTFIRLYRSDATALVSDTPSDEMFQSFETGFLTSANFVTGSITIEDTAPESVLDVPLYTNENTGSGPLQANFQPPVALDLVYWANRMWFGNTYGAQSLIFNLIGVGSPDGIQVGDTFTIGTDNTPDQTYTAASASSGTDFGIFAGDPGYAIEQTARSLVRQINLNPSNDTVAAFYISNEGGLPGKILLMATSFGVDPFSIYSSRGTAWTPQLPTNTTPAFAAPVSSNNAHAGGLFYSRLGIPDAVPLVNFQPVNSDNDAILRIFPLHYRLIVFKTDGIYSCTNVEPLQVQKISAYVLIAPDSVQVLEDRLYALTDQGEITISDAGVEPLSKPIDAEFTKLTAPAALSDYATRSFGVSYRSARQYLLWTIEKNEDSTFTDEAEQSFVYSTESDGFTRYPLGARCGGVNPDGGALCLAAADDNVVLVERKTLTEADFTDDELTKTATACSGSSVTLSDATGVAAGDMLEKSGARWLIQSVSGNILTVLGEPGFSVAPPPTVTILVAIATAVEFNKMTDQQPATMKMGQQATLLYGQNSVHDTTVNFHSEIQPVDQPVTKSLVGWGEFPWGEQAWGSPTEQLQRIEPLPPSVANCCQLSVGFETRQARASFEFLGVAVVESPDTEANHGG